MSTHHHNVPADNHNALTDDPYVLNKLNKNFACAVSLMGVVSLRFR
jgi:hypothetical protein